MTSQEQAPDGEELKDVAPDPDRLRIPRLGLRRAPELHRPDVFEEEARRVANLGMLLQERRKSRIRRQVGIVPEKRRVGPEDPPDRRGQLLEELFERFPRFPGVLVLVDEDLGGRPERIRPARRGPRPAAAGRQRVPGPRGSGQGSRWRNGSRRGGKSSVSRLLTYLLRSRGVAVNRIQGSGIRDQGLGVQTIEGVAPAP